MRAKLNAFIRDNDNRAYSIGFWDCATFAFGAVEAQTGVDHIADYRGRYTDHEQAVRLMKEIDRVATVRTLVTKKLGKPVPVAFAKTGDVVSIDASIGILYGGKGLFLAEHYGYERVPRALLDRAWHVPR